jgi:predicted TIM-barrel fold metal-dependent hydrolase
MPKIDVHCHLFSEDVLTFGGKILTGLGDVVTGLLDDGDYDNADTKIELLNAFLEISDKKPADGARVLLKSLGKDSVIVPLMYDMFYLTHDQKKDFAGQLQEIKQRFNEVQGSRTKAGRSVKKGISEVGDNLLKNFVDDLFKEDSFAIQRRNMKQLKKRYKERVYPFMSYDPRRAGNLELIKKEVGPDSDFHGVKLYTPLGFSPTHPAMMAKDGLYDWCQKKGIPITAHCSCRGRPTMNSRLYVPHSSWVYDEVKKEAVQMQMDTMVNLAGADVSDKAEYFTHPSLWEKVLEKYPRLRLNLAHFGGDRSDWREYIFQMIDSGKYPNLYTDVSYQAEEETLADIRERYYASPRLRQKLMYGSDFTILLMSSDLHDFQQSVQKYFPDNNKYRHFYEKNARRFLKL